MRGRSRLTLFLAALLSAAPLFSAGVFRWEEGGGGVSFGDRPPPDARELPHFSPERRLHRVAEVLDGDTLRIANGPVVRLIGVDAPELPRRDRPGDPGAERARDFLREQVDGTRVRLEREMEYEDRYGRALAHVVTEEGRNLNAALLREGLAHATVHPPNVERAGEYFAIEAEARAAEKGIWKETHFGVFPAREASDFRNTFRRLHGRVESVVSKRRYTYLHLSGGLLLQAENADLTLFADAGRDLNRLRGRRVTVRGWVGQRDGAPFLHVRHPLQIESVD